MNQMMNKTVGSRFGRFVVVSEFARKDKRGKRVRWVNCLCDCGTEKVVVLYSLKNSNTRSCGCLQREVASDMVKFVEGVPSTEHPLYRTWQGMRDRCSNRNYSQYSGYGGRGIKVCQRWLDSFKDFVEDMGPRPEGYSIDRKDNDGDYTPENCRWASRVEQSCNRRDNKFITYNGETLCYAEWDRRLGGGPNLVGSRIKAGWSEERAVSTPVATRGLDARPC